MSEYKNYGDVRLLARVTHDLLATENFTCLADLTEALKRRCARLKIGWTNDAISDAYRMVRASKPLTDDERAIIEAKARRRRYRDTEEAADHVVISKAEAAEILKRFGVFK